jgi:uncharacterized protein (TIGR01440 family)
MIKDNIEIKADGTAEFSSAEDAERFLCAISEEARAIAEELIDASGLRAGQILVVGCSSSEVTGNKIGKASVPSVADAILDGMLPVLSEKGIYLAAQCCEHLNRAIIIENELAERIGAEPVCVRPVPKAGGSFAAACFERFSSPVAVEHIRAHAGIDIGGTLIGMHLREVAVPVRLTSRTLGEAAILCARTRPKYIGGERAVYN